MHSLQEADQVSYDLKYALRLCSECDHKRACIHIYTTMGLYDEAVDLALQVSTTHGDYLVNVVVVAVLMTLWNNEDHFRRPPPLSRLWAGTVSVQAVVYFGHCN